MGPFIWTNLNPLHPRMHCAKFGWNWRGGSGEGDFKISSNVFSLFGNYLPLEKDGSFIWINLNPLYPRILCAKFCWNWPSTWFWRRRWKCGKFTATTTTMTTTTGKFWSEKLTCAFGSGDQLKTKQKCQYCQKPRDIWIKINLIKIGCKFCSLTSYTYIWGQICTQRKKQTTFLLYTVCCYRS